MILVDIITGCWNWQGKPTKQGYGQLLRGGKNLKAHRYVYEQIKGPIEHGYDLHHKCKNKLCVNPDHLEPKTKSDHAITHGLGAMRLTTNCTTCGLPWFICDAKRQAGQLCTM